MHQIILGETAAAPHELEHQARAVQSRKHEQTPHASILLWGGSAAQ
jgi:hypothetical protein